MTCTWIWTCKAKIDSLLILYSLVIGYEDISKSVITFLGLDPDDDQDLIKEVSSGRTNFFASLSLSFLWWLRRRWWDQMMSDVRISRMMKRQNEVQREILWLNSPFNHEFVWDEQKSVSSIEKKKEQERKRMRDRLGFSVPGTLNLFYQHEFGKEKERRERRREKEKPRQQEMDAMLGWREETLNGR